MQTLLLCLLSLQLAVLFSFSPSTSTARSTFAELEQLRRNQTYSVNDVAPVAKKLNQKFILWLS
jgi:hypothetical protein